MRSRAKTCCLKTRSHPFIKPVSIRCRDATSPQKNMKGDLRKLFAFLTSKNSDNHRRPRSVSIACQRDAINQGMNFPLHKGDGRPDRQSHFPNNTVPRRRKSQPVIRDRGLFVSETLSGRRCNFGPVFRNPSSAFERRKVVNVNLDKSIIMDDFENEDIRKVWSSLKDRSIFSETSIQDGFLTTTLCSTEL